MATAMLRPGQTKCVQLLMECDAPVIVIRGAPGVGKSFLASRLTGPGGYLNTDGTGDILVIDGTTEDTFADTFQVAASADGDTTVRYIAVVNEAVTVPKDIVVLTLTMDDCTSDENGHNLESV